VRQALSADQAASLHRLATVMENSILFKVREIQGVFYQVRDF